MRVAESRRARSSEGAWPSTPLKKKGIPFPGKEMPPCPMTSAVAKDQKWTTKPTVKEKPLKSTLALLGSPAGSSSEIQRIGFVPSPNKL